MYFMHVIGVGVGVGVGVGLTVLDKEYEDEETFRIFDRWI